MEELNAARLCLSYQATMNQIKQLIVDIILRRETFILFYGIENIDIILDNVNILESVSNRIDKQNKMRNLTGAVITPCYIYDKNLEKTIPLGDFININPRVILPNKDDYEQLKLISKSYIVRIITKYFKSFKELSNEVFERIDEIIEENTQNNSGY